MVAMRVAKRIGIVLQCVAVASLFFGCALLEDLLGGTDTTEWGTTAVTYRGQVGSQYTFRFPAGGTEYAIWGTDVYTDDSDIGTAAVHAGLITFAAGGTVTIEIADGQSSYTGSTRNGVTSGDWGEWYGSFIFVE
jgi:hypothetical protein